MIKTAVMTPDLLRRFGAYNRGKPYAEQIKPSNLLLSAYVDGLDRPLGAEGFHLIAPYTKDPRKWPRLDGIDIDSGKTYRTRQARHRS